MKKRKKHNKPELPTYVIAKFDPAQWYVRRNFPTNARDAKGRIKYIQVVRRCWPHTPERAKELAAEIERMQTTETPPADEQTIEQFIRGVLKAKRPSIGLRTHEGYVELCDRYIKGSHFAGTRLIEASPLVIQAHYSELQTRNVSGSMIRKLHAMLSMAFNQGVHWSVLAKNPCRGVILPRANDTQIEVMPENEAQRFAKTCFSHYLVLAFALETGMRPSEYLALRWSEVDLNAKTARVIRAVSFSKAGGYVFKEPKTRASRRTIQISDKLRDALLLHKGKQAAYIDDLKRIIAAPLVLRADNRGDNYRRRKSKRTHAREYIAMSAKNDLVFPSSIGGPVSMHNLANRTMKEACTKAGVAPRSPYSLRHTCFTLMLAGGADIKTVSTKAGHSNIQITLQIYIHVLPEMDQKGIDVLVDALYV